jgi:hypothetical protein
VCTKLSKILKSVDYFQFAQNNNIHVFNENVEIDDSDNKTLPIKIAGPMGLYSIVPIQIAIAEIIARRVPSRNALATKRYPDNQLTLSSTAGREPGLRVDGTTRHLPGGLDQPPLNSQLLKEKPGPPLLGGSTRMRAVRRRR